MFCCFFFQYYYYIIIYYNTVISIKYYIIHRYYCVKTLSCHNLIHDASHPTHLDLPWCFAGEIFVPQWSSGSVYKCHRDMSNPNPSRQPPGANQRPVPPPPPRGNVRSSSNRGALVVNTTPNESKNNSTGQPRNARWGVRLQHLSPRPPPMVSPLSFPIVQQIWVREARLCKVCLVKCPDLDHLTSRRNHH